MKQTIISIVGILAILISVSVFHISFPLSITTRSVSGEFSVVGEGKVDAKPDTAIVDVGITINNSPTVEQAQKTITLTNNAIIQAMEKLNIPKEQISTANYSVYPIYEGAPIQKTIGYSGNVTISIKVRDTAKVSQVITDATAAGANTIQGVRFSIDDPDKLRAKAREIAIKNAKEHATELSKSLGIRLGNITNIVEEGNHPGPYPYMDIAARGMGGGGGPIVEPGTQTVSTSVTLFFEKK